MSVGQFFTLLKEAYNEWSEDNCLRLGASLAYYTLSSLIPLILVVASVGALFLNFTGLGGDLRADLVAAISERVQNPQLAEEISNALTAREGAAARGILGSLLGFVFLLVSASGVFGELDAAFNIIWDVPSKTEQQGIIGFVKAKFLSFSLVLGVAFLLLVSQILTISLNALAGRLPLGPLWTVVNFVVQIGVITAVFALLYKFLPDVNVEWRDVWVGGLLAAVLWIIGQQLLALYFRFGAGGDSLGVLGGVIAFLLYVYYSSQILFFGGEFTQVYARTHGSMQPVPGAPEPQPAITREAALLIGTASSVREDRHREEIAALKTRQYAAAATGGIVGLIGGAVIGGVGLIVGLARGAARLRGR